MCGAFDRKTPDILANFIKIFQNSQLPGFAREGGDDGHSRILLIHIKGHSTV